MLYEIQVEQDLKLLSATLPEHTLCLENKIQVEKGFTLYSHVRNVLNLDVSRLTHSVCVCGGVDKAFCSMKSILFEDLLFGVSVFICMYVRALCVSVRV